MNYWRTLKGEKINVPIEKAVEQTIIKEIKAGHKLKVCIGTDSQVYGTHTSFATVIVFLRKGCGGFMYIQNERSLISYSLKERMLLEVGKSIEIAYELVDIFNRFEVEMEIHADINTNPQYKSNIALTEATGYLIGMGFQFKTKPEAFASSNCADKMVN